MLRDRCAVCPVYNVGVLWPNSWMDQGATWHGGRPRPRRHCVRWGPSFPTERGTADPHLFHVYFGPCLLWLHGRPSQQLLSSYLYNDAKSQKDAAAPGQFLHLLKRCSVPVQLNDWEDRPRNDPLCVERDVKQLLTHSFWRDAFSVSVGNCSVKMLSRRAGGKYLLR